MASNSIDMEDFEAFDDDESSLYPAPPANTAPSSSAVTQLPPDPPTISLFRVPTSGNGSCAVIPMDQASLLDSAARDSSIKAIVDVRDVPRARLMKLRQFVHLVDPTPDQRARELADQLLHEEADADAVANPSSSSLSLPSSAGSSSSGQGQGQGQMQAHAHAQLRVALQLARQEVEDLQRQRRQLLTSLSQTRQENLRLKQQLDAVAVAVADSVEHCEHCEHCEPSTVSNDAVTVDASESAKSP